MENIDRGLLEEALIASATRAITYLRSTYVSREPAGIGKSGDLSREFDVVVEDLIFKTLREYFGEIRLVSEERGTVGRGSLMAIIDPVDGSVNFEAGLPIASVSIGVARNSKQVRVGDIEAAVVAEVFRDVIYFYDKLRGFKALGMKAKRKYPPSNIVLGYFESVESFRPYIRLPEITNFKPKLRSLGSAALDIVYVSLGIALGFIDARAKLRNVDVAPSIAIANSLGAKAYLCNGENAVDIAIDDIEKIECLVVGYDDEIARALLKAVSSERILGY
ncbi:MAG: inositol monophosphatase family protein [Sulfolobales archaeon]